MTDRRAPLATTPGWRRAPYRPLFLLGFVLAWAGIAHWIWFASGHAVPFRRSFHALVQIQGFMAAFALGFLFTMIPRRTQTAPPAPWQMVVAMTVPVGVAVCAWFDSVVLAETLWLVLVAVLVHFAAQRFGSSGAGRKPPNAFVWIPLSFLASAAGAVILIGWHSGLVTDPAVWRFGWLMVTQGLFLGLIFGVGSMVLPLITRGESSADAQRTRSDRLVRALHVAAWLGLLASFWLEAAGHAELGHGVRATIATVLLVAGCRVHRPPTVPGAHRRARKARVSSARGGARRSRSRQLCGAGTRRFSVQLSISFSEMPRAAANCSAFRK